MLSDKNKIVPFDNKVCYTLGFQDRVESNVKNQQVLKLLLPSPVRSLNNNSFNIGAYRVEWSDTAGVST